MANKTLFKSLVGKMIPASNSLNQENAPAYRFTPKHQLAQYGATGCLSATFYASAQCQLDTLLKLCDEVDAEFIGKVAIYCREKGFMKDVPAVLCAVLSLKDPLIFEKVFFRVIDNMKMLRNFVQIMRSGAVGRKSLGSLPRKLIRRWLASKNEASLFKGNVGQNPSLPDIIKMVHPRPDSKNREAFYGYLIGKDHEVELLPEVVRAFEAYKAGESDEVPDIPFQMLTSLSLGPSEWTTIAKNASWRMTLMNLNTFERHQVFGKDAQATENMAKLVADRLSNPRLIARSGAFPYQIMTAYGQVKDTVPTMIKDSLQSAMEIAIDNVPEVNGKVYVCPDVSGSMKWAYATGQRKGATSVVRCIDVAALVAAAFLRKNKDAQILPFDFGVVSLKLNPRDSIMTNAEKLADIGGGGTNCSAPLKKLNKEKAIGDLVVFVSDNESWLDASSGNGTSMLREWNVFRKRNPNAKLVCIDIQPYGTTQASDREDILNVGGFSDQVFELISEFVQGNMTSDSWVSRVESVQL